MTNITICIPDSIHARLTAQCAAFTRKTGLATRSHIVRLALVEWLDKVEGKASSGTKMDSCSCTGVCRGAAESSR